MQGERNERPARVPSLRRSRRLPDAMFAGGSVLAIMEQPHIPLGLPGYRALMWLGVIVAVRLLNGRGWPTFVGLAAAVGTLLIGRSPDGVWGILQYIIAAVLVELVLLIRPRLTHRLSAMIALGAGSLVLVGWIAPVGQGLSGGASMGDLWYSLSTLGLRAWTRLIGFDLLFGAGAGLIGVALAQVLSHTRIFAGEYRPPDTGKMRLASPSSI